MKKFLKKKLGNEKGMTLIELLAVIVILAIIAAIAIPAIGNIIENSRVGSAKSNILNAQSAAELYLADNPGAAVVTLANLQGVVLDDPATTTVNEASTVGESYLYSDVTLTAFNYDKSSRLITATSVVGNVTVTATNATKAQLAELPSNSTGAVGTTLSVTRN